MEQKKFVVFLRERKQGQVTYKVLSTVRDQNHYHSY